jgi:hypothetical protein
MGHLTGQIMPDVMGFRLPHTMPMADAAIRPFVSCNPPPVN